MSENDAGARQWGEVKARLEDVRRLASYRWQHDLTQLDIAHGSGLDKKTVGKFASGTSRYYYLHTLTALCWYFDNQPKDLLVWMPAMPGEAVTEPKVGRREPPSSPPPLRSDIWVVSQIPDLLASFATDSIVVGMGVHRTEVDALRQRFNQCFAASTLAKLLTFLTRELGQPVGVGQVLVYQPPPDRC